MTAANARTRGPARQSRRARPRDGAGRGRGAQAVARRGGVPPFRRAPLPHNRRRRRSGPRPGWRPPTPRGASARGPRRDADQAYAPGQDDPQPRRRIALGEDHLAFGDVLHQAARREIGALPSRERRQIRDGGETGRRVDCDFGHRRSLTGDRDWSYHRRLRE